MPDYNQASAQLLPEALRKVQEGNTVLQSFPRQAAPRASHFISIWLEKEISAGLWSVGVLNFTGATTGLRF
jgi:hypothetical protein